MKVHAKVVGEYELDGCCAQSGLNVLRKVLVRKGMKKDEETLPSMCIALPSHMDSQLVAKMMMMFGNLEQIRMKMEDLRERQSKLPSLGGNLL